MRPRSRRLLTALAALVAWGAGLCAAAGRDAPAPVAFRAHHMVLDAVSDGTWVYAATQSGRINRFHLRRGAAGDDLLRLVPAPGTTFAPPVYSLALSPDGRLLAAGTGLGDIRLFALPAGRPAGRLAVAGSQHVLAVRFAGPDALLFGLLDGTVGRLRRADGAERWRRQAELAPVSALALSPDERTLAVATRTTVIGLFRARDGEPAGTLRGHRDAVRALAFAGPRRLLSGGKDGRLLAWNLDTGRGRLLHETSFYVDAVAWDGAGRVAFALPDYRIGLLGLADGRLRRSLGGHTAFLTTLRFLGPGRLLSAGNDARILVHDTGVGAAAGAP